VIIFEITHESALRKYRLFEKQEIKMGDKREFIFTDSLKTLPTIIAKIADFGTKILTKPE